MTDALPEVEVRTVIVLPKFKGRPIWRWVGKRFAGIAHFDAGTLVVGVELLEAGIILFLGPFALSFAHVRRQAEAFDRRALLNPSNTGGRSTKEHN